MSSSSILVSDDPDEFRAVIRPQNKEYLVSGRGQFSAVATQVNFEYLWLQHLAEALPRAWHVELCNDRWGFGFVDGPTPWMVTKGVRLAPTALAVFRPRSSAWHRSLGNSRVASLSLPTKILVDAGVALCENEPLSARNINAMYPPQAAMARLRQLHADTIRLAHHAPETLSAATVVRQLEASIIEALIACLKSGHPQEDRAATKRHTDIMNRLQAAVVQSRGHALHMSDLCQQIGVNERTLQACCQEQLGMSPKRYLLVRRMMTVRRRLRHADPDSSSVTGIATELGFWELGRFAVQYKKLFGESPSQTLRAPVP